MNLGAVGAFFKKIFNWRFLKEAFEEWSADNASRLAAALAYYTATALAPLLIGILAIVGLVVSREQIQSQVMEQVNTYIGPEGAQVVQTILANADQPNLARFAGILSLIALIWSASNIFAQLQESLNTVWGVQLRPDLPLIRKAQHRLVPLVVVLVAGLLLLAAIIASTALSTASDLISELLPGGTFIWQILNILLTLAILTLMFGIVFKVIPDVNVAWKDVWPGAALTAILFLVGQYVLSWYLGRQSGSSVYGAAGSLIVLLLWLYYSAQIFLFGAEYVQVYATRYGEGATPDKDAVPRQLGMRPKAAAQGVDVTSGRGWRPQAGSTAGATAVWAMEPFAYPSNSGGLRPLAFLIGRLIDDGRHLIRQEFLLMRTEIQENAKKFARSAAMISSGGLLLYGGALFLVCAIALLLWVFTVMPLWGAFLLVGVLLLVEGWILTVWARRRLTEIPVLPEQTIESLRQDGEVIKEHVVG